MLFIMRTHDDITTIQAATEAAAIRAAKKQAEKNNIYSFILADSGGRVIFLYKKTVEIN